MCCSPDQVVIERVLWLAFLGSILRGPASWYSIYSVSLGLHLNVSTFPTALPCKTIIHPMHNFTMGTRILSSVNWRPSNTADSDIYLFYSGHHAPRCTCVNSCPLFEVTTNLLHLVDPSVVCMRFIWQCAISISLTIIIMLGCHCKAHTVGA